MRTFYKHIRYGRYTNSVVSELRIVELLVISIFPVAGLVFYSKYSAHLLLVVRLLRKLTETSTIPDRMRIR
jgi:hypothetical protein